MDKPSTSTTCSFGGQNSKKGTKKTKGILFHMEDNFWKLLPTVAKLMSAYEAKLLSLYLPGIATSYAYFHLSRRNIEITFFFSQLDMRQRASFRISLVTLWKVSGNSGQRKNYLNLESSAKCQFRVVCDAEQSWVATLNLRIQGYRMAQHILTLITFNLSRFFLHCNMILASMVGNVLHCFTIVSS